MTKLWALLTADAFEWDRFLAFMAGARNDETLSEMCGHAQAAGKPWGCIACRILDVIVVKGHCQEAISANGTTTGIPALRAGLALACVGVAISWLLWAAWALFFRLA